MSDDAIKTALRELQYAKRAVAQMPEWKRIALQQERLIETRLGYVELYSEVGDE